MDEKKIHKEFTKRYYTKVPFLYILYTIIAVSVKNIYRYFAERPKVPTQSTYNKIIPFGTAKYIRFTRLCTYSAWRAAGLVKPVGKTAKKSFAAHNLIIRQMAITVICLFYLPGSSVGERAAF